MDQHKNNLTSGRLPGHSDRAATGIAGLDAVLAGGITAHRLYLVEGTPGTGKTTFGLQFLLEGAAKGESGLYITLSETASELKAVAASHGWSLEGLSLFEMIDEADLSPDYQQSILHPSEVELGETIRSVMVRVNELKPSRVIFDSLSEMRLLAQNPLRYRRQILALKHFFATRNCTVLMLDDRTSDPGDLQLHSIAHGVITLEQLAQEFGSERRRLRVVKMRGIKFSGGYHDFLLETGGMRVFPRLVAADHAIEFEDAVVSTGVTELDTLLGGGLVRGTNTLLSGPSGVGKTTTSICCVLSALRRGERAAYYLFDEGVGTLLIRSRALGMDIAPYIADGSLTLYQINPAEMSPGEFASRIRQAVEQEDRTFVVIDSLNAYLQAMPGEKFLLLQMHEVLTYLSLQGVTALLVLGQHGLVGEIRSDVDLSYLSDTILMFRFFEAHGDISTAVSVIKSRTNHHARTIHEFRLSASHGVQIGEPLQDFEGIMSGLPSYRGKTPMLNNAG
ncbi:ATPase domain-containing protein [Herbaspirillum rhizosphaerae]|uniref:ATPase domain-containing protein n=1 Tax=Herbaspirillum rhizosphaerae TaxID=346179 RepID=UPI00067DA1AC|nr:ATPase domain-containing protein [Herbaspirillum rhizosphaerae]